MKEILEVLATNLIALLVIFARGLFYGLIIWPCWNCVMPLFGLEKITYLGACCLFILCKLLLLPVSSININNK